MIVVAAGVNGAGKSTLVGALHQHDGATYFNPDERTRALIAAGVNPQSANEQSWNEGYAALRHAIDGDLNYSFETTLGGESITSELLRALALGREVILYFVGLESAEMHIERVRARVRRGGHDIPEAKIRERFVTSHVNLLKFIGTQASIVVFDNSCEDEEGIPDPRALLRLKGTELLYPDTMQALRATPDWAKPVVQLALKRCRVPAPLQSAARRSRAAIRTVK